MDVITHQYAVVWTLYCIAGVGCCVVWWKITSFIANRALREMLLGFVIVLIYTPWYAGQAPEFYAPAIVVLLMDVLLEGTRSGLKGGIVLLFASLLMLIILSIRHYRRRSRG